MSKRSAATLAAILCCTVDTAAADDADFLLECKEEGEIAFHVEFYPDNKVKLILASGAADGLVYTSENFYRLEFPANSTGQEYLITINRLSKIYTYEAGRPPFGAASKENKHASGKCAAADRKNIL